MSIEDQDFNQSEIPTMAAPPVSSAVSPDEEEANSDRADAFFAAVDSTPGYTAGADPSEQGGGMNSTLVFIGILVAVNVASAIFGWGFWLY